MATVRLAPPVEYLRTASQSSLQSFELSKLNRAANLRRDIAVLIDQWLEETGEAMLARYMIEHHGSLRQPALSSAELLRAFQDPIGPPLPGDSDSLDEISPAPPRFADPQLRISGTHGPKSTK